MEKLYEILPRELVNFALVTLFSLFIGLSQRKNSLSIDGKTSQFGTDRTFTYIGILGYLLYILDTSRYVLFILGAVILGVLLAMNYYVKQIESHKYGITTILIAFITYCLAPILDTQPMWFFMMVIVVVLLLMEMKETFTEFAHKMQKDEVITLAKFLAISGIILPMLPDENIIEGVNLTPHSIWLATVVVSGISYLSYLVRRYVFPQAGILLSGILGGLYSSTATISVLARKSRHASKEDAPEYAAAMILAVGMMFLRFLILIGIFNKEAFLALYPYLILLLGVSTAVGTVFHVIRKRRSSGKIDSQDETSNPLEFKVALIFALLFVVFTLLTHYTFEYTGEGGISVLSFLAGVSDITPFILNLLQGPSNVAVSTVSVCILQAMVSNIIVNLGYALFFSARNRYLKKWLLMGFSAVISTGVVLLLIYYVF